jgi:hypothetical protein
MQSLRATQMRAAHGRFYCGWHGEIVWRCKQSKHYLSLRRISLLSGYLQAN